MNYQAIHKKVDVALVQLESAISAYEDGRYIESITLAGASEEILGALCRRKNMETAVEKIANLPPIAAIDPDQSKRIAILNHARNCLKHARDSTEDEFEIAEEDPFFMIVRAIANLEILGINKATCIMSFKQKYTSKTK